MRSPNPRRRLRLAGLLVAMSAVSGGVAVGLANPVQAATCTISTTYREGMTGSGVNCIEKRLNALGYQWSYIDYLYGSVTTASVKRFQYAKRLTVTGVVDKITGTAMGIWSGTTTPPPTTTYGTYTVVSGDSLYGIAAKTQTPIATLLSLNNLTLSSMIYPGMVLKVLRATTPPPPPAGRIKETRVIGYSVRGRAIVAYRLGTKGGTPILAVGNIHGDEPRGTMITNYLLNTATIPTDVELWVIRSVNPDGLAAGTRTNARKVDLNRNFNSGDWIKMGLGTEKYSGPYAASEPETRAVQVFINAIKPKVAVWWHQVGQHVDDNHEVANYPLVKRYGAITGYPLRYTSCVTPCRGTATGYINHRIVGSTSFVVEMPSWYSTSTAALHAKAFLAIGHEAQ